MRKKKKSSPKSLVYDSDSSSKGIHLRCPETKQFFSCAIRSYFGDGFEEQTDIVPQCKLTLDEMVKVIREQYLDTIEDDDMTKIHFKIYAHKSRS